MKRISSLAAMLGLALLAPVIHAQQQTGLTREIELGALFTSGNTEEQSLNFAAMMNVIRDQWEHEFSLDGLYTSSEGTVKGQRIYGVAQTEYEFTEYSYLQARLAHEDDRFSGFDSQSDLTFSYGRELLRGRNNMTLNANLGAGARYSIREDGSTKTEPILRAAGEYSWALSDTAEFNQNLSVEKGSSSNIYRSLTAIEAEIMENLTLRFSFKVKHQTVVPVNRKNTDTETAITFVMNF